MRARFETFHLGAPQCCAPNSICTFFTNKLEPRDPATIAAMKTNESRTDEAYNPVERVDRVQCPHLSP